MVGIGVGGGSRRSGEEEAGGLGRRQHHPLVAARLVTGGVCVCLCVCVAGGRRQHHALVWCLLELIAKAMTPHPSGSGRCIGYEWARH